MNASACALCAPFQLAVTQAQCAAAASASSWPFSVPAWLVVPYSYPFYLTLIFCANLSSFGYLFQALHYMRNPVYLSGIKLWTVVFVLVTNVMWVIYGFMLPDTVVLTSSVFPVVGEIIIVYLCLRHDWQTRALARFVQAEAAPTLEGLRELPEEVSAAVARLRAALEKHQSAEDSRRTAEMVGRKLGLDAAR